MITVWIDGDGCPRDAVQATLAEGEQRGLAVVLVTNIHHEQSADCRLVVDGSSQAVDLAILNRMKAGDLVITGDIGLAALALGKQGYAIHPNGTEFDRERIDLQLEMRESAAKHRRGGGRSKGPKKRTGEDAERFRRSLIAFLNRIAATE
jgi:uncharacterized protein YaiI (UPF0178 family)